MEKREETKGRNQTPHIERNEIRKNKSLRLRKTMLRKVIPYILVGCIASSAVMMAHNEAREVKAVAVVDDIILLTALLAMGGIAYVGVSEYWTNGQWLEGDDSPILDPDMAEWGQGFSDRIQEQWDNDVLQKAIELGYVDPETGEYIGALEGTGGNTGGDNDNDDDNNKFPTWRKLKEIVAKNNGNISQAIGTGVGFLIGAYTASMLDSSSEGAKMPGGLPTDINTALHDMDNAYGKYCEDNKILISDYPYNFTIIRSNSYELEIRTTYAKSSLYVYKTSELVLGVNKSPFISVLYKFNYGNQRVNISISDGISFSSTASLTNDYNYINYYGNIPISLSREEGLAYYNNPYPIYPDKYINPSTVGKSTALAKKLAETGGDLTKSLYENVTLPTTEQLEQYFEDLNSTEDEEEKQKIMDEFVDSLVNPTESPNPNPNPENPDKPVNPDNPDNPTNNDTFLADLKHLFPFCIPFDLVDCFRLFNAEPVTPRVESPVHFGIINYDHTFVIDLKDFNNVAVVCRSTFLIIYMTGLILATRALIKG